MEWLEESERALDSELEIAKDPDKIKTQLTQHKVSDTSPFLCPTHVCYLEVFSVIRSQVISRDT